MVVIWEELNLSDNPRHFELEGNKLYYDIASYVDTLRGYFAMTEEEAIEQAWEIFNKIPFIDGEYECIGIRETFTLSSSEGENITRAGVVFCRVLDGIRVVGEDSCTIYFDGSGLVAISIKLYDYYKFGIMKMVPLKDAVANLINPDSFSLEGEGRGAVETLEVNEIKLRYTNQYTRGCKILQPVYVFKGNATLEDKTEMEFGAKIIAIPEFYTYE